MLNINKMLVALVIFLGLSSTSQAAVLHDESINGDLGTITYPTDLESLTEGTYSVIGSMTNWDRDTFTVDIGAGYSLDGFKISIWDSNYDGNFAIYLDNEQWVLGHADNTGIDLFSLSGIGPFTDGTFHFGTYTGDATVNYEFELSVSRISVVPLPAALPLYGAGLALLGFLGHRRSRKSKA